MEVRERNVNEGEESRSKKHTLVSVVAPLDVAHTYFKRGRGREKIK